VVRGVPPGAFDIRPEIRVAEGRTFASASEVWTDLPVAQTAFRRDGTVSSMHLRLTTPEAAPELDAHIAPDPRLDLQLRLEPDYYSEQSRGLTTIITDFGYPVASIMAVGAVFAALTTLYSAVAVRTVKIATLRAMGFGGVPIIVSVMIEAIALALLGGLLSALLVTGVIWTVALGAIGGLFPAVHEARLPITVALRGACGGRLGHRRLRPGATTDSGPWRIRSRGRSPRGHDTPLDFANWPKVA
jgi:putative ABC transport system permease protein